MTQGSRRDMDKLLHMNGPAAPQKACNEMAFSMWEPKAAIWLNQGSPTNCLEETKHLLKFQMQVLQVAEEGRVVRAEQTTCAVPQERADRAEGMFIIPVFEMYFGWWAELMPGEDA